MGGVSCFCSREGTSLMESFMMGGCICLWLGFIGRGEVEVMFPPQGDPASGKELIIP